MTEYNVSEQERIINLLSNEIRDSGYRMNYIARKTGLSPQTVSKLYYRETRFPRHLTIITLLAFFGYGLYARKSNNIMNLEVHREQKSRKQTA